MSWLSLLAFVITGCIIPLVFTSTTIVEVLWYVAFTLAAGLIAAIGGLALSRLLRSSQRLLGSQEALVDVGVHLLDTERLPGSLQLSDTPQSGQLSLDERQEPTQPMP